MIDPYEQSRPPRFTEKQGQYLAFISTLLNGRPPAETDMQRFFRVTPPSVHQMILGLAKARLIERTPGASRSIRVLVGTAELPALRPSEEQAVKPLSQ